MDAETQRTLPLGDLAQVNMFGEQDRHLRAIERRFGVRLVARNGQLTVRGPQAAVNAVVPLVEHLARRARNGETITDEDLGYAAGQAEEAGAAGRPGEAEIDTAEVVLRADRRVVRVRSSGQAAYVRAMRAHEIVFAIGPAGTGKTYLAVAAAVHALKEKQIDRLVLVRPAVEAGERLGFLPGDLQDKVDPYLRPLYDALRELMSFEKLQRLLQLGVIEVAPLAYMRGRTLASAWVILDEAQNTTLPQMKMFLTRLGPGARAVITGDITQIDLEEPEASGLVCVRPILEGIPGIAFVELAERDVARHRLVREIVQAFAARGPATPRAGPSS
ncbi:MAG: PhoH family protein [Candidatus Eisenbacteria bacterium]|uniref:PhoH-like protein n=1 Tax=Eiseniibacteriota bacterium TaxID=2212470 RepID=A0A937X8J7_UNCEI|nr:PhoH family protein [Candidatus Eisenbacteria bacterium]